jgi:hypothetical protein
MPLTIPRVEELRKRLYKRATRLANFAKMGDKANAIIVANEVAMVIETASLLLGEELVDRIIAEHRQKEKWRKAGLCVTCGGNPRVSGTVLCAACVAYEDGLFALAEDARA